MWRRLVLASSTKRARPVSITLGRVIIVGISAALGSAG
jgi:hypothetical protein